tara:strand:- start:1589 stop:2116 length:528 start_codon:yes stop_codon:yes gene_type:complete
MIFPGQSLTAEPKNAPYENPPEMTDPEDAVLWHLERLAEPDRMNGVLDTLELGLDVVTITEGLLRSAVLAGRHSIDVSLLIAPAVHELINSAAKSAKIDYEEGFPDDSKEKEKVKYQINARKAQKMIDEAKDGEPEGKTAVKAGEILESLPKDLTEKAPPAKEGLMSRKPKEGVL